MSILLSRVSSMRCIAIALTLVLEILITGCNGDGNTVSDEATIPSADPGTYSAVDIPAGQVDSAIQQIDGIAASAMEKTGLPGMSIAVVHDDQLVYAKGFGVKQAGLSDPVDENTVFQIASVSKPVGATVVAATVGDGIVSWEDNVVEYLPDFALADPYVTQNVTIADFYAHRSGLPEHAGDLLEDIGYDRAEILRRLRYVPLDPFRANYNYTNFGLTAGAEAVARANDATWGDLSKQRLYDQLGMASTSSNFADFMARQNRALGNVMVDGNWQPTPMQRLPDAQSPAGGVSSSAADMAKWMRMILGDGSFEGVQVVASEPLNEALNPQMTGFPATSLAARPGFYGLGFNVGMDGAGRTRFSHSGAFLLGSGSAFTLLPSENLGIIVLTNGEPVGAAEAVISSFMDLVETGSEEFDWLTLYTQRFAQLSQNDSELAGLQPPANPAPARPHQTFIGVYDNEFYGPASVAVSAEGGLVLRLGPQQQEFPLQYWDGNTFAYFPAGENAVGISAVTFVTGANGSATVMTIEFLDKEKLGTFTAR